MAFFTILAAFVAIIFLYLLISHLQHQRTNALLPPGPKPLPIIGNLLLLNPKTSHQTLAKLGKEYGGIFRIQVGWRSNVWITSYKLFREAVIQNSWTFAGRPHDLRVGLSEADDFPGIAASGINEDEKEIRRFTLVGLRSLGFGKSSMQEIMLHHSEIITAEFSKKNGQPFDPRSILANAAANVISAILLGRSFPPGDPSLDLINRSLTAAVKAFFNVQMDLAFPILKLIPRAARSLSAQSFKAGKDFLRDIVGDHVKSHVTGAPQDFIDIWLDQSKVESTNFSPNRLPSALMDLFLGGIFVLLLHHPDVQKKIHTELDQQIGRGKQITLEDRDRLVFTEAVILETLRLFPLVPFAAPHMAVEAGTIGGHHLPNGTRVILHLWSIHHDEDLWEDPEIFRPERFIKEGKLVVPEYFVPFSAGRRSCIGEQLARKELFLFFANIIQEFEIKNPPGDPLPSLEFNQGIVIYPNPFNIVVTSRR